MPDTHRRLLEELQAFFQPLVDTGGDPAQVHALFDDIGWRLSVVCSVSEQRALAAAVDRIVDGVSGIASFADDPPSDLLSFILELAGHVGPVMDGINQVSSSLAGVSVPDIGELPEDLLNYLVTRYLDAKSPLAIPVLELLGIANEGPPEDVLQNDEPYRMKNRWPKVELSKIGEVLSDPAGPMLKKYWPDGFDDDGHGATLVALRLLAIASALELMDPSGGALPWGGGESLLPDLPATDSATFRRDLVLADDTDVIVGLDLQKVEAADGGPGATIFPFGTLIVSGDVGPFNLRLTGNAEGNALKITGAGVEQVDSGKPPFTVKLVLSRGENGEPAFSLGDEGGLRLSLQSWAMFAEVLAARNTAEILIGTDLKGLTLGVHPGSGDGFIGMLLPPDGIGVTFDLGMGWSSKDGLYFGMSGGLEVAIPVHREIGPISVETIYVSLAVREDRSLAGQVTTAAAAKLGPLAVSIDRIGLASTFSFPRGGGNAGPMQVGASFEPPTGAGLVVDTSGLTGAGYLEFDKDMERYAGIVQLSFTEIGLTAIGLITTRMHDGSKGFSMVLSIVADFSPPLQLSFGFTLSGVGGLIGIHRTMMLDVLRDGLRNGTLDSVLLPSDPITNASQIISDMRAVFPPEEGRFVIGPMVKVGWGPKNIITAEIAILIEMPSPVRIAVLGQIFARLPSEQEAIIVLNVDVLGTIDFGKKALSIDASLFDSRILQYALTGDAALRWNWGNRPEFAMSLGGFHPKFTPPSGFPSLQRLALNLSSGSDFRLTCETYAAITPNTLQFGARVELYARASGATLDGYVSFDALFDFSPFRFVVEVSGGVSVRYKGHRLAGVRVVFTLSGPTPWNARGRATFSILYWDVTARFNKTWGSDGAVSLPEVDPLEKLQEVIEAPESWGSRLPSGRQLVAAMKPLEFEDDAAAESGDAAAAESVAVHPVGSLEIRQNLVPLDFRLDKLGNSPIKTHHTCHIESIVAGGDGGDVLDTTSVWEFFARGQFEDLSSDQRLSLPSFERMPAGIAADTDTVKLEGESQAYGLRYEPILIDKEVVEEEPKEGDMRWTVAERLLRRNAVSIGRARGAGLRRFESPAIGPKVTIKESSYTVVYVDTLRMAMVDRPGGGEGDAPAGAVPIGLGMKAAVDQAMEAYQAKHPDLAGKLRVVPEYEAVG